jgi:hypothetical protein
LEVLVFSFDDWRLERPSRRPRDKYIAIFYFINLSIFHCLKAYSVKRQGFWQIFFENCAFCGLENRLSKVGARTVKNTVQQHCISVRPVCTC